MAVTGFQGAQDKRRRRNRFVGRSPGLKLVLKPATREIETRNNIKKEKAYCTAWTTYTQGNVVSDSQAQKIQNFALVMAGIGKHENEEETGGSRVKRETLGCAGQKLDSIDIRAVLHEIKPTTTRDDELNQRHRKAYQQWYGHGSEAFTRR